MLGGLKARDNWTCAVAATLRYHAPQLAYHPLHWLIFRWRVQPSSLLLFISPGSLHACRTVHGYALGHFSGDERNNGAMLQKGKTRYSNLTENLDIYSLISWPAWQTASNSGLKYHADISEQEVGTSNVTLKTLFRSSKQVCMHASSCAQEWIEG